jgi:hypothetical protein
VDGKRKSHWEMQLLVSIQRNVKLLFKDGGREQRDKVYGNKKRAEFVQEPQGRNATHPNTLVLA